MLCGSNVLILFMVILINYHSIYLLCYIVLAKKSNACVQGEQKSGEFRSAERRCHHESCNWY